MLELAILGLLHESPMHGYELRKQLDHQARRVPRRDQLRLALPDAAPAAGRRLDHRRAAAPSRDRPAEIPPMTSRRGRVVYKITAEGKERFQELLAQAGPETFDDPGFGVHFAFFARTDQQTRVCGSWRVAGAGSRSAAKACATCSAAPPNASTPTRSNCSATDSTRRARGPLAGGAHRHRALRPDPGHGRRSAAPPCAGSVPPAGHHGAVDESASGHAGAAVMKKEAAAMGSVRVAIVGVGNCASSLVQGVEYYRNADPNDRVPGLMHVTFGDYHVSDVEFVAAFDVDAKKVGQ